MFCSGCFRQIFFHLGTKKVVSGHVRQVVVLYSNDCMGIGLGRLKIGCLRLVIIEVYRGSRLNRFDCISRSTTGSELRSVRLQIVMGFQELVVYFIENSSCFLYCAITKPIKTCSKLAIKTLTKCC